LLVLAIVAVAVLAVKVMRGKAGGVMACKDCGTIGDAKSDTKGSIGLELVLWICFIVPGLIYSVWRLTTRHNRCKACGSTALVPLTSPAGIKLQAEYGDRPSA